MVSVLSVSAFAEFGSTDSTNLSTIKNNTTYAGKSVARWLNDIWIKCDTYFPSLGQIEVATKSTALDVSTIADALSYDSKGIAELLNSIDRRLTSSGNDNATWLELINTKTLNTANRLTSGGNSAAAWLELANNKMVSGGNTVAAWTDLINSKLVANGNSAAGWLSSIDSRLYHGTKNNADYLYYIQNNTQAGSHGVAYWAQQIFNLQDAERQKQEDALGDYSSAGGRSASDTSSDVGAISGSLSNSFNSGVSASSALNAVEDNESDFEYFFFGMHDDLNTAGGASSGGAKKAPRRHNPDSGNYVPDFLSDYWGGLNG